VSPAPPPLLYQPQGCSACQQSGYRGRQGIYELVLLDDSLRQLIHAGAGEHELLAQARQHSPSLFGDGCALVLQGRTSLEELLRVTQED
jgi:general secretion pathway protein E